MQLGVRQRRDGARYLTATEPGARNELRAAFNL